MFLEHTDPFYPGDLSLNSITYLGEAILTPKCA